MGRNSENFEIWWAALAAEIDAAEEAAQAAVAPQSMHALDALFSVTQQRVLALLFGQPDAGFHACELVARTGSGSGAVQRELQRLEASGLVTFQLRGKRKHYRANPHSPIYAELAGLLRKTRGLAEPLREALAQPALQQSVDMAFVYHPLGPWFEKGRPVLELLVIGTDVPWEELQGALAIAGQRLRRRLYPLVFEPDFLVSPGWFLARILEQPRIWVIGSERVLARSRPITCGP